jgi:hypothetical protein
MSSSLKLILIFLVFSFGSIAQTFTSSNLPIVVVNTNGQTIVDEPKIIANMGIIWNGPGKRNTLNDPMNNYNGKIGIEIRGSSSQYFFPKKSYGFETKSSDLEDIDVSLLDMPEENDWILYAPYTDKTLIRDVLTYTLGSALVHYSPRCRFVELFVNGNYQGVYVLMEKIKRNKNRVNIAKLKTTDNSGENLTGGYIIKIDKTTGGDTQGWTSNYTNAYGRTLYLYDYPKFEDITSYQKTYIQTYVRNMEDALYKEKYTGTGNYHEFLNDSSFIDFMIINELTKNVDGYRISSYLYKGKNDVMNCGPIWDFNLGFGNANYYNGWITSGFQYQADLGTDQSQTPFWWNKLMKDPNYVKNLKKRWAWIRKHEFTSQRISFVIDSLTNVVSEAKDRNYQKWTGVIGSYIWPNYYIGTSYSAEVVWMKNWITKRLAFLDQSWPYDFTGTDNLLSSRSFSVFPNPFVDQINIELASTVNGDGYAEIYSSGGALIRKNKIILQNGKTRLNFSGNNLLSSGLYVLRITFNDGVLLNEKIVKR